MSESLLREIRLAFCKAHILHHAAIHPVYGLWLLEELAEHGHRLSPGTLYPILARMTDAGLLRADAHTSGKARRHYRATAKGRRALAQLRKEIEELYREVVRMAAA
jgi:PadR family transcriptional regulator, regulatory protein PadR